ncbi:MAG TPA: SDR family NAD(P)-dependent oxidoreductase [Bacteroidales bacterium]|nr:SDR family NAD(P)-dependent oxidoreductase [Bacteroidales bacterium]HNS46868.1 SDR family NAD(P)-dependent oxidoreductase [Bacteroidales bacterium]
MPTIIITGANGNLGLVVTEHLLNSGYQVIAITGPGGAGQLTAHRGLVVHEADLMDEEQTGNLVATVTDRYPDVVAAVLLVGGFATGKLQHTSDRMLEDMIRLNFHSAFHMVRPMVSFFEHKPEGGQFILIGSRPAINSSEGINFFAYSLSKAMVVKLAEFIDAEGRDKKIRAAVIVPGTIDTPANRRAMPDADFTRWVPPQNIAETIAFCLSETGKMLQHRVMIIDKH